MRVFCGDLLAGIVNLSDNEEKIVSFPGVGIERQSAGSDPLLGL
jgi:hypothetical protein